MRTRTLDRWILFLALAGMILALHLWVQKARDFDQGCFGVTKAAFVEGGGNGCREVSDLPASHLFGVSNAAWGYAFYFALALASVAKIVTPPATARRLHLFGETAVAVALVYSAYLVYTMAFVAKAYCVLCLTSAALVTGLAGLHLALRRRGGFEPVPETARSTELGLAVIGLFAATGGLVAMLLFVNRIGTRPLNWGSTASEIEQLVGQSLPIFIDSERLREMRTCRFELREPALDLEKTAGRPLPMLGKRGGPTIVAFFDPNCDPCRAEFGRFMGLAEKFRDQASFVVVARPLWDKSLLQAQALRITESSDKYFEVWRRMMERKDEAGMDLAQIRALFAELGLPTEALEQRLAAVRREVLADRDRAEAAGVTRLPTIYIASQKVSENNYSDACLEHLLKDAEAGPVGVRRR
jgi:uncharacterized membrane protein/thiol-disulfide isomerase/thioredoxin